MVFWMHICCLAGIGQCRKSTLLILRRLSNLKSIGIAPAAGEIIEINGAKYIADEWTNVTPRVLSKVGQNLQNVKNHPLNLIKRRIVNFFNEQYVNRRGNPIFSVYDQISPVVSLAQNFDSLLVPLNHPSRAKTDSYYISAEYLLRAHTSAHQADLLRSGLNAFLVAGDVYRRDEIDATHYPVFHQMEGVRVFSEHELFSSVNDRSAVRLFEQGKRHPGKQDFHTEETVRLLEYSLKTSLQSMAIQLFNKDVQVRWIEAYFPFTHPSWELEILMDGEWVEMLGCGIMEQEILHQAGAGDKVGWAFGLGLERFAMKLYGIPDIRLFWSTDSGFLSQFNVADPSTPIKYKPVSTFPCCFNDVSFWIPSTFSPNDFFEIVRSIGGEMVEQVHLVDTFCHPKTKRHSHCYRITYRHMERVLSQAEVSVVHNQIRDKATTMLGVELR